jgi:hypothetical protein
MTRLGHVALVSLLGLAAGMLGACFSPPSDDVLFSCEYDGEDTCPPDYSCEPDNCCHRIGSDVDANLGGCALGGNSGGTSTGTETETETETGTETDTGTETGTSG